MSITMQTETVWGQIKSQRCSVPWCLNFLGRGPASGWVYECWSLVWWVTSLSEWFSVCCHAVRSSLIMRAAVSLGLITLKTLYLWLPNADPNGHIYTWTAANNQYTHKHYGQSGPIINESAVLFFFFSCVMLKIESHGGWLTFSFFFSN